MRIREILLSVVIVAGALSSCGESPSTEPAALASSPAQAHGWESVTVQGKAPVPSMGAVELSDLTTLAEQSGRDVDEVVAGQQGREEFDSLTTDLETDPQSGYVAAGRSDDGSAWIRFTDRPDNAALQRIEADLPIRVEVQWGAPLNAKELEKVSQAMFGAMSDYPGVDQANSEILSTLQEDVIGISYSWKQNAKVESERLQTVVIEAGAAASPTGDVPVGVTLVESAVTTALAETE